MNGDQVGPVPGEDRQQLIEYVRGIKPDPRFDTEADGDHLEVPARAQPEHAQDAHQADGRLDYNLSSVDRFFFRYSELKALLDNSTDVNQFFQNGADSNSFNQNLQFTHQRTFGPTKMNELRLSYNRTNVHTSNKSVDKNWNDFFGIKNGNLGDPITQGLLEFDLDGSGASDVGHKAAAAFHHRAAPRHPGGKRRVRDHCPG